MHQAVLDVCYNNFIWCETKFYLLQQNILVWNKCLLIATTLFWCEIRGYLLQQHYFDMK